MILPFSTQLNGKPTYFVEKIWEGILQKGVQINMNEFIEYGRDNLPQPYKIGTHKAKLHTIRADIKERWEKGKKIHFVINNRTKNMAQFAPIVTVVSVQDIFMTRRGSELEITVAKVGSYMGGEDIYLCYKEKCELALNDGFDTYDEFKEYFFNQIEANFEEKGNNWFSGKIIHWTNHRY